MFYSGIFPAIVSNPSSVAASLIPRSDTPSAVAKHRLLSLNSGIPLKYVNQLLVTMMILSGILREI
jgi:hypothetical protein